MIRRSRLEDIEQIRQLIKLCFGEHEDFEPYNNLNDRYYLYFKDNNLVAMTGLIFNKDYKHLEVDWTCTHPEHRHKGYM